MGPFAQDDPAPWILEPVAGMIDAGETPETAALRELREEAGYGARILRPIGEAGQYVRGYNKRERRYGAVPG